jgi:hypothetical protein
MVWWDAKFDSTQFQKKTVLQSEFVCKSYDRFTKARPSYGSGRQNMTKVDPMDGKAQIGCHNESRVGEARVHVRRLAKVNRLM